MKNKIILHVPHSSSHFPFLDGFLVDEMALEKEILKLTDWYTDELFFAENEEMVIANFSRIFCDPERFENDSEEVMAQFGMGVLYEKSDNGDKLRSVTDELRKKILSEYYNKHHQRLNNAVNIQLSQFGKALILDCHSFPSTPFLRDLDQNKNRPDFNIGVDEFHTDQKLVDFSVDFFKSKGFTLGINWPYAGSIVPMEHYRKNKNVGSIMLEINRSLYLREPSNMKSEKFPEIKRVTSEFIQRIKTCYFLESKT